MKSSPLVHRSNNRTIPTLIVHSSSEKSLSSTNNNVISGHLEKTPTSSYKPDLPLGIYELANKHFVPGVKSCFEKKTNLPVLKSTKVICMKNRETAAKEKKSGEDGDLKTNGHQQRNSVGSLPPDNATLHLVKTSWEIVLSFMGDDTETLEWGQSTRLFESTISERRKQFSTKHRLLRKSSNFIGNAKSRKTNRRPASVHVNRNTSADDPPSEEQLMAITKESIARLTVLEKVQFLTTIGLENVPLQDEIYCHILKQLVSNPSVRSSALGWILLSLIVGCFSPSKKILAHVQTFIQEQQNSWSAYCADKLLRTLINGSRNAQPCSLELQAAKSKQKIRLPVICMDHSVRTIWADSSTTADEICRAMASKNRLGDSFGFSLFLALDSKLVTLGNGNLYIMDAISQAEQFSKLNELHDVWRIYYRREFFTPLDAVGVQDNQMKAWLTYSQIIGGVQSEEYNCKTAQDLSLLLAHQYCVRHGVNKLEMKKVMAVCEQCLPTSVYKGEKKKQWCQMVLTTLQALAKKDTGSVNTFDILGQVIRYSSKAFIQHFTKTFLLASFDAAGSEANHANGDSKLALKINHHAMSIMRDDPSLGETQSSGSDCSTTLLTVAIEALRKVENSRSASDTLHATLDDGTIYTLRSSQASEIFRMLERFIKEINSTSKNESEA